MTRQSQSPPDPTRVVVSSVVRGASLAEPSGFVRIVDLDRASVIACAAVPEARHLADDPNPRGGLRGGRGVSSHKDTLVVASNDTLFVLDPSWRLRRELSHPLAGGIHDVHADEDGIWVSSTASSMVLKFSWDGDVSARWHWTEDRALVGALGFSPHAVPELDPQRDYRVPAPGSGAHDVVHLNAVWRDGDRLLVNLGQVLTPAALRREQWRGLAARLGTRVPLVRRGVAFSRAARQHSRARHVGPAAPRKPGRHAIVSLKLEHGQIARGTPAELIWLADGASTPKHNLMPSGPDTLWFIDSEHGCLVEADTARGVRRREIAIPGAPPFARGLLRLSAHEALVGSQRPAALYRVNLDDGSLRQSVDLAGEPSETVYAITAVPASFERDPAGLAKLASLHQVGTEKAWTSQASGDTSRL